MNPFELKQYRQMARYALSKAGANDCPLKRAPKDDNGQASGDPEVIGTLYGIAFRKGYSNAGIRIDLPGIVAMDNSRRFAAVASDTILPQAEDLITIDGRDVQIIRADVPPGNIIFDILLRD